VVRMNLVRPPIGIGVSLFDRQSKSGSRVFVPPDAALQIAVPDHVSGDSCHAGKPLGETAVLQVFGRTRVRPKVMWMFQSTSPCYLSAAGAFFWRPQMSHSRSQV